ncbi:hypothetical protein HII31_06890 [Pseudocercospora fuligena]|uniref:Uncharacterized protein n=1 Tax=Pseudocercospora fuligena TaxID=685502 RepID=A0A8H6VHL5_9PEZI|nr:hypothetical protein HII31_06890 [Pseudocercospora fuligena]
MMECDVGTAYTVETPFCRQVQRPVRCILEILRNSWFMKGGFDEKFHQNLDAHMTESAESMNFSGSVERCTIDELRETLRKARVDGYEDGVVSRLGKSTPFVFCLVAASDLDGLLPLYSSLQEHFGSGFDEITNDAASVGEGQSSDPSSVMDSSDEDDISMLDEDEDEDLAFTQQDSGSESDQHMDCDSSGSDERPESEDECLERELAGMMMCDGEP